MSGQNIKNKSRAGFNSVNFIPNLLKDLRIQKEVLIKPITIILTQMLTPIYYLKYRNIWKFKEHLQKQKKISPILLRLYENRLSKYGSWIGYNSIFSSAPIFPHGPVGVFISNNTKIGNNAVIFQHVTIGSNTLNDSNRVGSPIIGDNVYIGAGAKIIGGVHIGNNCRIGANAVVYRDMPPNSVAVQSPTRIIQKQNLDNRYYSEKDGKWAYYKEGCWIVDETKRLQFNN